MSTVLSIHGKNACRIVLPRTILSAKHQPPRIPMTSLLETPTEYRKYSHVKVFNSPEHGGGQPVGKWPMKKFLGLTMTEAKPAEREASC